MNIAKIYKELSVVQKITLFLFITFLVVTACCNRLSIDDLFFKYRIDTAGLFGIIDNQYSRVMAYFLNGCVIAIHNQLLYVIYNLLSIFVFAYCLLKVVKLFLPAACKNKDKFAVLFFLFFFVCCSAPSEIFFWYTQVSTYLWCINCILIVTLFLAEGFTYKWQIPIFLLACLFIGSSSEFLALQFLVVAVCYCIRYKIAVFTSANLVYIMGGFLLVLSLLITILSPGLETRSHLVEHTAISTALIANCKFFLLYFSAFFRNLHLPAILVALLAFASYGATSGATFKLSWKEILFYFTFIFTCLLITTYTSNDIAPARSRIIFDLMGLFLLAKAGAWLGWRFRKFTAVLSCCRIGVVTAFVVFLGVQAQQAIRYAQQYDEREQILRTSASDPVHVKPLQNCYFLYTCNISSDPQDFRNQHLRLAHKLQAQIVQDP